MHLIELLMAIDLYKCLLTVQNIFCSPSPSGNSILISCTIAQNSTWYLEEISQALLIFVIENRRSTCFAKENYCVCPASIILYLEHLTKSANASTVTPLIFFASWILYSENWSISSIQICKWEHSMWNHGSDAFSLFIKSAVYLFHIRLLQSNFRDFTHSIFSWL